MKKATLFSVLSLFSMTLFAQAPAEQGAGETSPQMALMRARMESMHEQMARIRATEDPEERSRLMREHMQSMNEAMAMMSEMMRGHGQQQMAGQCRQDDVRCRMDRMQMQHGAMGEQMGMMQQMMQQMMEHMMREQADQPGDAD